MASLGPGAGRRNLQTPKALRPTAQGCRNTATLEYGPSSKPTPTGLWSLSPAQIAFGRRWAKDRATTPLGSPVLTLQRYVLSWQRLRRDFLAARFRAWWYGRMAAVRSTRESVPRRWRPRGRRGGGPGRLVRAGSPGWRPYPSSKVSPSKRRPLATARRYCSRAISDLER